MRRRFDWLLIAAFGGFALSTFTVDVWAVTGRIHGDDALARALHGYTSTADPLFGKMPFYVWALMAISLAMLPLVNSIGTLIAISAVIAVGNSFTTPSLQGLASRFVDARWQGRAAEDWRPRDPASGCGVASCCGRAAPPGRRPCGWRNRQAGR